MQIRIIGWLIDKGCISPAFGRGLEALAIGLLASVVAAALTALADGLEGGFSALNWQSVLAAGLTAGGLFVQKAIRDAARAAAKEAEEYKKLTAQPSDVE